MLVPAGHGSLSTIQQFNAWEGMAGAAPLEVTLSPYTLDTPLQPKPANKIKQPARVAEAIATQGKDKGTRGDTAQAEASAPVPVLGGIAVPHYYPPRELTQRARILNDLDPHLGDLENTPGVGKAILMLWINESGGVDKVEVESSALQEVFEKAVVAGFLAAQFQPAERESIPVKSLMRIEVNILPRSRFNRSAAEGSSPSP